MNKTEKEKRINVGRRKRRPEERDRKSTTRLDLAV